MQFLFISTHNVGRDTTVKAAHALFGIHSADQGCRWDSLAGIGLRQSLEDVKGVANHRANSACEGSDAEFQINGGCASNF
jgi:hypothetical protein